MLTLAVNGGVAMPPGEHAGDSKVCVKMENSDNMQYVIPLEVGQPGQSMTAIPDTGSFELVVPSTWCSSGCKGHPLFNASQSLSFKGRGLTQVIHYGQGDVTTEVDYDTVKLGGMQVHHQSLLQMTNNGLENYDLATYDAVMGLGLSEQARPNDADLSLLASMSERVFGICLGQNDMDPGRLDLGGGVPELEGQYEQLPCAKNTGHWGLSLDAFHVGDEQVGSGSMDMIVDSGTSLLAVPTDIYDKVLELIDPVEEDCSNIKSLPDLHLTVGDKKFVIPPDLYVGRVQLDDEDTEQGMTSLPDRKWGPFRFRGNKGRKGRASRIHRAKNVTLVQDMKGEQFLGGKSDGVCLPLFMELNVYTDDGPLFILGMPFLRAYAVRFDLGKKTLGFAKMPLHSKLCSSCSSTHGVASAASVASLSAHGSDSLSTLKGGERHSLLPSEVTNMGGSMATPVGPVKINMRNIRLPWWAVHESEPREAAHPHPRRGLISADWRHIKM